MDAQLLRLVLPTRLLNEVDRHLAGEGSSRSRADFVQEAVEQRLLELRFGNSAQTPQLDERALASDSRPHPRVGGDDVFDPLLHPQSLIDTRLPRLPGTPSLPPGRDALTVERGPLFLHGRDYPSFWCLWWLARWADIGTTAVAEDQGALELSPYLSRITECAWTFAEQLQSYDQGGTLKATTMLPTSRRNRDSSSQTFQTSAVGGVVRRRDGSQVALGPLPLWGVATIYAQDDRILIAPTRPGLDLLAALEGLSLELPHSAEHSDTFLKHLRDHAPGDYDAFRKVLGAIAAEPNREELIGALTQAGFGGTGKLADVYTQAYVSRGREWGLIEPRLVAQRYNLTERGHAALR